MSGPIELITAPDVPTPRGPYSHAAAYGDLIAISGQIPISPDGSHHPEASFADQARQALGNLLAIAQAAGSGADGLLKVTVYIVGIEHWGEFNAVYEAMMGDARPARAVVPVPELHYGYLVEVEALAVRTAR